MKKPIQVRLQKELSRHLRAGHPWIFRDAIRPIALPTGSVVDVHAAKGGFVARGLWDAHSPIAVRVYTLDPGESLDGELVRRRIAESLLSRRGAFDPEETDAFRLLNGEGDYLPGVVCDVYRDTAVLRFDGDAARTLSDWVVPALVEVTRPLGVSRVYERSRGAKGRALHGDEPPEIIEVRESGVRLSVDVRHGQKTGAFLDQRENRKAIRPYSRGARVANLFSYTGGFSLHAALAGAAHVTSVDSAAAALDGARRDFARNGLDPGRHAFVSSDVFDWLARARAEGSSFELMIVDPPSFAPSERSVDKALSAYRDLFASALALVVPNGVLAASSCSSHVDAESFLGALRDAAAKARRALRVLEVRGQPADHPTPPAFKEGRYLKFVLSRAR